MVCRETLRRDAGRGVAVPQIDGVRIATGFAFDDQRDGGGLGIVDVVAVLAQHADGFLYPLRLIAGGHGGGAAPDESAGLPEPLSVDVPPIREPAGEPLVVGNPELGALSPAEGAVVAAGTVGPAAGAVPGSPSTP